VLQRVLPERCQSCAGATLGGLCSGCRAELRAVIDPCPGCGLGRPVRHCPRQTGDWYVGAVIAPLSYHYPLDQHIHRLKFLAARPMGRALGLVLAEHLNARAETPRPDALLAVPLHKHRLIERGYNQALEIARALSAELGIPLLRAGAQRRQATQPQSALGAAQRARNMAGVFRVTRDFGGLSIVLVDDVITTGATINSLARTLHRAGAREVQAWAVARALPYPQVLNR